MSVEFYLCEFCKHYDSEKFFENFPFGMENIDINHVYFCAAYPDGIPADIFYGREKHFTPRPDDNGLQFEPLSPESVGYLRRFFGYPW